MKTLDQICVDQGADKGSTHPVKGHDYARHYDKLFGPIRMEPIKLMEIGVGGGESIRSWLEYFPRAKVYGVDIVHSTNPWNTVGSGVHPRYTFITGDQSCGTFWKCYEVDYGTNWDVVIDDGGHYINQIIKSFECLWPLVSPGGLYCIEDLGVAYGGSMFVPPGFPNHMDWVKGKLDEINRADEIDSFYFAKELVIFRKCLSYSLAS